MMTTLQPPKLHPAQREVWRSAARFQVLACGRRWGKTRLAALRCVWVAVERGRAWWVAPSYPMSQVGWRLLRQLCANIPGVVIRDGDRLITLPGGGSVQVRSADNPDSLRGEGLDFVALDECAFIVEDAWTQALRPALAEHAGGAMFISTPRGRNWFWRLHNRALDGGEFACWQFPTASNPYIAATEIAAAREIMPERAFRQEFLAEFMDTEGAIFRNIEACLYTSPDDAGPEAHAGHMLVMGADWAKQSDFTALSVGCVTCRREVATDRFNQIDYAFQRARLAVLAERWRVSGILAEKNSMGSPIVEQLQRDGLPVSAFDTTAASKPPLIENMALAFERAEWQFLDLPIWTAELQAYEGKANAVTGRTTYSAPDGMHDDTVICRALMLRAAGRAGPLFWE